MLCKAYAFTELLYLRIIRAVLSFGDICGKNKYTFDCIGKNAIRSTVIDKIS